MSTEEEYYIQGKAHYPSAVGNPWVTKRLIVEGLGAAGARAERAARAARAGEPVVFVPTPPLDVVNEVLIACGEVPCSTQEEWVAKYHMTPDEAQAITDESLRLSRARRSAPAVRQPSLPARYTKISTVAQNGACPKCGGSQFKAKRSAMGKLGLGVLAPKTQVRCVTCGTTYRRG